VWAPGSNPTSLTRVAAPVGPTSSHDSSVASAAPLG